MTRSDAIAALLMGFASGVVLCVIIFALMPRITPSDLIEAHQQGQRDALKTNPASEALERVCAGLWMSRQ